MALSNVEEFTEIITVIEE